MRSAVIETLGHHKFKSSGRRLLDGECPYGYRQFLFHSSEDDGVIGVYLVFYPQAFQDAREVNVTIRGFSPQCEFKVIPIRHEVAKGHSGEKLEGFEPRWYTDTMIGSIY